MVATVELLRQGNRTAIWNKYCGFLDLSLQEFMAIQKRLLMEQIGLLCECELGKMLLGDRVPATIDEFRAYARLTNYTDYMPYLADKREECLPVKPHSWLRTSGRTGEFGGNKWIPYSLEMAKRLGESYFAIVILAAADGRGQVPCREGDRLLFTLAPFPYITGALARGALDEFPLKFLPPLEQAEQMPYDQRIQAGLNLALRQGLDHVNAMAIVLVRVAQQLSNSSSRLRPAQFLMHPAAMARLIRGLLRARRAGRKQLLPKDLWTIKGIATGGTDTTLFKDQIRDAWGRRPIECYGCTEGGLLAVQPWANEGLVFLPHGNFLEFISMDEFSRNEQDPSYQPQTVLLDQVELGGIYEVVITNFYGGALTRYRMGDLVRISALRDEMLRIDLPKIIFHAKTRDVIDLGSFVRFTERTIWKAIEDMQIPYADWTARKEYHAGNPYLYVYLETRDQATGVDLVQHTLDLNLGAMDSTYNDIKEMMGLDPLRVVLVPQGAFNRFTRCKQAQGAELAFLKPPHMQISDRDLALLMGVEN